MQKIYQDDSLYTTSAFMKRATLNAATSLMSQGTVFDFDVSPPLPLLEFSLLQRLVPVRPTRSSPQPSTTPTKTPTGASSSTGEKADKEFL